jgi:hypothetical protein
MRDASNCSAVKEKPRFQVDDRVFSAIYRSPESWFGCRHYPANQDPIAGTPVKIRCVD